MKLIQRLDLYEDEMRILYMLKKLNAEVLLEV